MLGMRKRLIVAGLSFIAVLAAYELASVVLGAPRVVGPILATVLSALVVLDPGDLLRASATPSKARRVPLPRPSGGSGVFRPLTGLGRGRSAPRTRGAARPGVAARPRTTRPAA